MKKLFLIGVILTNLFSMDLDKYGIVFSASNMEFVMEKVFKKFYQKYPNDHILVQYSSTGVAKVNILKGDKYDMFISSNKKSAMEVYKANKAITKPQLFTQVALILVYKNLKNVNYKNYNFLANKKVKKILIGDVENSVFGNRAIEVLKNLHIYKKIKDKLVIKRDVAEVVDNLIWSQNNAGFIPKSVIYLLLNRINRKDLKWIDINPKLYSSIKQYFVISKRGIKKQSIKDFANFLLSDEGQKIFTSNGFLPIK